VSASNIDRDVSPWWFIVGCLVTMAPAAWLGRALGQPMLPLWSCFAWILYAVVHACGGLRGASTLLLNLVQLPWSAWVLRQTARAFRQRLPWWRWPQSIVGRIGAMPVRFTRPSLTALGQPVRVSAGGLPIGITIEPEGVGTLISKAMGKRDVETGDADFDRRLLLIGETYRVLAALDTDTRRELLRLAARWSLRIVEGDVHLETRRPLGGHRRLISAAHDAVDLAQRAAWRRDAFQGLAENALHDPLPGVRLNNLEALARDRRRSPEVLHAALSDSSERIRLRAAVWLGAAGHPTLLQLAEDPATSDECAAEAIRGLREALSEAQALALLESALARRRNPVVRAAVEALGLSGTVVAVPRLRAVIEGHPLDFAMKRAADEAVARIQSRLEGAEAGQLAVAEGDAGQLTLADSAAGRLSLDHTPRRSEPESA
jgi:hypothetical protein